MATKKKEPLKGPVCFQLQRQQAKAFTCPADEILYGGAAGGGLPGLGGGSLPPGMGDLLGGKKK